MVGHVYSVLGFAAEPTTSGKIVQLVNLRNPWGDTEWTKDWSDKSPKWDSIPKERRDQMLVKEKDGSFLDDGAFWMCYKDYVSIFTNYDVCLLPTKITDEERGPCFHNEKRLRGTFQDEHVLYFDITVKLWFLLQVAISDLTRSTFIISCENPG